MATRCTYSVQAKLCCLIENNEKVWHGGSLSLSPPFMYYSCHLCVCKAIMLLIFSSMLCLIIIMMMMKPTTTCFNLFYIILMAFTPYFLLSLERKTIRKYNLIRTIYISTFLDPSNLSDH